MEKILKSLGMNAHEFATQYDIPYITVYQWKTGKRTPPSYVIKLLNEKIERESKGEQLKIEEKKTLIELPCKVGDIIWCIDGFCDDSFSIEERTIRSFSIFREYIFMYASKLDFLGLVRTYNIKNFGKTVFLTREEAEKRLKESYKNDY